jgi:ABC-type lipoprotein export system ATPase subunit
MSEADMVSYRKNTVGFVWQKSARNLFPYMTALENVEAPMYFSRGSERERRKKALSLLEMTGIAHKADSYPREMSGGEQQRVAIAVALANDPKILLADEPTGAVDSKTSDMLQNLFHELNDKLGITIIIVTHDISLANKVGRVVMISDGKISTEKIMKEEYRKRLEESGSFSTDESHDEYSVLDKAGRLQLGDELLAAAGIETNMVNVRVEDGKIVITHRDSE